MHDMMWCVCITYLIKDRYLMRKSGQMRSSLSCVCLCVCVRVGVGVGVYVYVWMCECAGMRVWIILMSAHTCYIGTDRHNPANGTR